MSLPNQVKRLAIPFALLSFTLPWGMAYGQGKDRSPSRRVSAEPLPMGFEAERCFDTIWTTIRDRFWGPDFCGVHWDGARERYRPKALACRDHESFAMVVNKMLGELRTSHTRYYTRWDPEYYALQAVFLSQSMAHYHTSDPAVIDKKRPGRYSGKGVIHRVGIGVVTRSFDGRHYVTAVLKSSPAQKAGIGVGDWLVEADGKPFHPVRSFCDRKGQPVELIVQRTGSTSSRLRRRIRPVDRSERELCEKDSRARTSIIEHKGHRIAYIHLWWLSGLKMRDTFTWAVRQTSTCQGVILDLRSGFGGSPAIEYADPFLREKLGSLDVTTITRKGTAKSRLGFNGPLVVLIDSNTRSGKELLAHYLKKMGRGILLGERTAGAVCGGSWLRVSDESLLYFATVMIVLDGKRLEGTGVEPDIRVPRDIRFCEGKDPQLERAKQEILKMIEGASASRQE